MHRELAQPQEPSVGVGDQPNERIVPSWVFDRGKVRIARTVGLEAEDLVGRRSDQVDQDFPIREKVKRFGGRALLTVAWA